METVEPGVGEEVPVPGLTSAYWRPEGVVTKVRLGRAVGGGGAAEDGKGRRARASEDWRRRDRRVVDGSLVVMGVSSEEELDDNGASLRGCWVRHCQAEELGNRRRDVNSRTIECVILRLLLR